MPEGYERKKKKHKEATNRMKRQEEARGEACDKRIMNGERSEGREREWRGEEHRRKAREGTYMKEKEGK